MKMTSRLGFVVLVLAGLGTAVSGAAANEYLRKGDQIIAVSSEGGSLSCQRVSDGFEMCNGMTEQADGTWTGKNMRHPDMPKFMKFRGTVTFTSGGLNIRGCALGICQSEDWAQN